MGDSTLALAERIWRLLSDPAGDVEGILDEMTHDGLAGLPPFVLVEHTGEFLRALVRGAAVAELRLVGEARTRSLSGHGFRSWREEVVPNVVEVVLTAGDATLAKESWLPVRGGIVRASELSLRLRKETAPSSHGAHRRPEVPIPVHIAAPVRDAALTLDQSRYDVDAGLGPAGEAGPPVDEPAVDGGRPGEAASVVPEVADPPTAVREPEDEYLELVSGMTRMGTVEDAAVRGPLAESAAPDPIDAQPLVNAAPPPILTPAPSRPVSSPPAAAPKPSDSTPGLISSAPFASARKTDARGGGRPTRQARSRAPSPAADDEAELTLVRVPAGSSAGVSENPAGAGRLPALLCSRGHASAPESERCRVCAEDLSGAERQWVERPVIGRLRFDGPPGVVDVRGPMVIGRAPRVDRVSGDAVPDLVTVPDGDVSRSHLRLAVEGWHVMVIDLGTTNGTVVQDPAGESRRLRPDEEKMIVPGCRVVLADTTAFVFEAQS